MQCKALVDERLAACGETISVCGAAVRCVCPAGGAPRVLDAPGTITLVPGQSGATFSGPNCTGTPKGTAEGGPMGICQLTLRDCAPGAACPERELDLSCGIREKVCGHPVVCRCRAKR
jgi:hypothetical protein